MAAKPSIAIVGAGRLGSALVPALMSAGYRIAEIISRRQGGSRRKALALAQKARARISSLRDARLDADLIWFCVPDREIARVAKALAEKAGRKKLAFHSSGALTSDELEGLRKRGAAVASVHPLMTFVTGSESALSGVPFALEGDAAAVRIARRIVRDLRAIPYTIRKTDKAAYHAWGAFTSPLIVALLASAEQVAGAAGVGVVNARQRMLPIVRQTVENYARLGPAGASSGPWVRGDIETVRKHLKVLKKIPEARSVYLALGQATLRYLPVGNRKKLRALLKS
ncbi:MAG TPA: DUF2520 domain-containing protein [Terriglobales bacterium]|nr:DUF2520 domain-containing protein [Terriglobales bacterium]